MLNPVTTIILFQSTGKPQTVARGEFIFQQGQQAEEMYGIIEGEVDILVDDKVIETIQKGDVFGIGALVHPQHTRTSSAIAKTDCQLVSLDRAHFLFAVQETPLFALEIIRSFSDRLRHLRHLL
jgi:CRP-like cAMP-binding protein